MMQRLSNWWWRASGTDAQPQGHPAPIGNVTLQQMERWAAAIERQVAYVDLELASIRRNQTRLRTSLDTLQPKEAPRDADHRDRDR
jgi:hypothetical protein